MPIRISVFRGRDKTSELYSVKEFGNDCLLVSLDKVLEYLDVINVIQADESNRSMVRTDVALFSRRAMREAVINAFLHNNYLYGIAPAFTVYSDRIEILSRGVLAPGQTREGFFLGESMPVNKGLSDIFLQLHISERSGRGVPIIVEEYGRSAYEFRENSIVVTIPFNRVYAEDAGNSNNYSFGTVASAKSTKTKDIQSKILDALVKDNSLKLDELAQSFGVSKATVSKAVAALKRDGKLKRVGSNKTGYWQVINL
jgi:predicted HTH transcriptional regulator